MKYTFTSDFEQDAPERIWIEARELPSGIYLFKRVRLDFLIKVRIWSTGTGMRKVELLGFPDRRESSDPVIIYV